MIDINKLNFVYYNINNTQLNKGNRLLSILKKHTPKLIPNHSRKHSVHQQSKLTAIAPLKLAPSAVKQINTLLTNKKEAIGIKLGVNRRGCNGYSYKMDYLFKNDLKTFSNDIHKQDGIKFVVEPKSLLHLVGTEMHYENTELSSSL